MSGVGTGQRPQRQGGEGVASRGTVIRIDKAKGFGFLVDSAGEHRFFHRTAVLDNGFNSLQEQQAVEFEGHTDERGLRALKVRPAAPGTRGKISPLSKPSRTPGASPKATKASTWRSDLSPFKGGSNAPTSPRKFHRI